MFFFWHSLYLFFVLGGDFIFVFRGRVYFFDWLELMELFRLYLGASLCIFFSSCHIVFVGLYMLGGVCFRGSYFQTSY